MRKMKHRSGHRLNGRKYSRRDGDGGSGSADRYCWYTGKIKYYTKYTADRRLKFEKRALGYQNTGIHKCKFCNSWHITHLDTRVRAQKADGSLGRIKKPYNRNEEKRKWRT